MAQYIIEGQHKVAGEVVPSGNKNEALPVLVSCLLTTEPIICHRMPRILDVLTLCDVLTDLGVEVAWQSEDSVYLCAGDARLGELSESKCQSIRAAILLLGPLLARFGQASLPLPGGDVIGARRIDTHFEGMMALGAQMSFGAAISGTLPERARGAHIFLDEPSVTATENILLVAVLAEG